MKNYIYLRGQVVLIRHFCFFLLGILLGFYFFFSFATKLNPLNEEISWWIRFGSILLIFYPVVLNLVLWAYSGIERFFSRLPLLILSKFSKKAKMVLFLLKMSEKGASYEGEIGLEETYTDILFYLGGGIIGVITFFIFAVIVIIIVGIRLLLLKAIIPLGIEIYANPHEFFGVFSAVIVLASYPVYIVRIWQRKITPNITSWTIFVLISVALSLSSFTSSGFSENSWVTIGPLIGCSCVLISTLLRSKEKSMNAFDIVCLSLACISIVLWYFTKHSQDNLVQYALYLGIFTDFIGLLPTSRFLIKNPDKDRPGMWLIFSLGYFLSMFAITDNTFANWSLPVFMTIAPALGWFPLVRYRIKNKIPLKEWI